MISFRYHIVTIVGVFLALAVGLLAGSAFVEPGLVRQLQGQTDNLREEVRALEADVDEARERVGTTESFVDAALPFLVADRLVGTSVVVIALEGVEDGVLGETQRSLLDAGASVVAVISARDQLASEDPETRARLAELLGRTDAAEDLSALAAEALAERLANGDGGAGPEDDLLAHLLSAGFLSPVGSGLSESTLDEIGSFGQVVVVLAGGPSEEPAVAPGAFAEPLVEALAERGRAVAAGESTTTLVPFVDGLRGSDGVVTVDDLDLTMGGAALVLGLDRLLSTGVGGAYGLKDGARPLPPT